MPSSDPNDPAQPLASVSTFAAYVAAAVPPPGPRVARAAWAAADLRAAVLHQAFTGVAWDLIVAPVEALVWLLPGAERAVALADVARARARLPGPPWRGDAAARAAERVRAFVLAPAPEQADDLVATLDAVPDADARLALGLALWPALPEPSRTAALRRALDAAFQVPDEVHAGQAVAAVVLRDPDGLLVDAIARAQDAWADPDARWSLREELAQKLPIALRATLDARLPPSPDDPVIVRAPRTPVVPEAGITSPPEALRLWTNVALNLQDDPESAAIAREAVKFLVDTAELHALARISR